MARYNPCLDKGQNVEGKHAWPASYCQAFMQSCSADTANPLHKKAKTTKPAHTDVVSLSRKDEAAAFAVPLQSVVVAQNDIMCQNAALIC